MGLDGKEVSDGISLSARAEELSTHTFSVPTRTISLLAIRLIGQKCNNNVPCAIISSYHVTSDYIIDLKSSSRRNRRLQMDQLATGLSHTGAAA